MVKKKEQHTVKGNMNNFHTFFTVPTSKMVSFTLLWVHICLDTLMRLDNNLKYIAFPVSYVSKIENYIVLL